MLKKIWQKIKRKLREKEINSYAKGEGILWLTGFQSKHDQIEKNILINNSFIQKESVKNWEAYPGHYVDDHNMWYLDIKNA